MRERTDGAIATKDTIMTYFQRLYTVGWDGVIADDIMFTTPTSETRGKTAYVEATNRFKQVAKSVDVKQLLVEDGNVCAVTRYQLQSPQGRSWECDSVEIFSVKDGKIQSSRIFFDTAAFGRFMAQG